MIDFNGLAILYFGFLGGVIGCIIGLTAGAIGLLFGWPFFAVAFGCTVGGGIIGFITGCFAK